MPRFEITSSESGPVFSNYSKSGGHGSTGQVKAGSWGKKSIKIGNVRCNKNSLIDYLNTQTPLTKPLKKGRLLGWGGSSDTAVSDAVTLVFTKKQVSALPRPATPPKPESKTPSSHSSTKDSSSTSESSDHGLKKPITPLKTSSSSSSESKTEDSSSKSDPLAPVDWTKLDAALMASDFTTMDKKSFDALLPCSDQSKTCLQSYSPDKIATLQSYFGQWHWMNLSDLQVEHLDFITIDKISFDYLFPYFLYPDQNLSKARLQGYSSDKIATMQRHFEGWHWMNLSDHQVEHLDFTTMDKKTFYYLFPYFLHSDQELSKPRLQGYSSNKIATMQRHFEGWHWMNLSDTQVAHLDFTTMDKKTFDYLFPYFFSSDQELSKARLQGYSSDKIATMQRHFEGWHKRAINKD